MLVLALVIAFKPTSQTGDQIWHQCQAKYAALKTYRDTGTVEVTTDPGTAGSTTKIITFDTAFVRSKGILFHFHEPETQDTPLTDAYVWQSKSEFLYSNSLIKRAPESGNAVESFGGIMSGMTGGASSRIPMLLRVTGMPAPLKSSSTKSAYPVMVDGKLCDTLTFKSGVVFSIQKDTLMIRRVLVPASTEDILNRQVVTTYHPEPNATIKPSSLIYKPKAN